MYCVQQALEPIQIKEQRALYYDLNEESELGDEGASNDRRGAPTSRLDFNLNCASALRRELEHLLR